MNRFLALLLLTSLILFSTSKAHADQCFSAVGKALKDAQTIRKTAQLMNWKVGKSASIAAGNVIKGKKVIYPQDKLQVCLRATSIGTLEIKAQSNSSDAGQASWINLPATKF